MKPETTSQPSVQPSPRHPGCRPLALWFLNHRFSRDEAASQIHFLEEQGFGGYFMHWINGGEPYMGKGWLDAVSDAHILPEMTSKAILSTRS